MSRVELARIPALTFYKDSLTESRRTKAIPQLICVGKPCKLYTPEVVRCHSLGGSGTEIDWKCEADLPDSLRFGRVEVSCEGWSRPGDPYVLKGSCSLEYRLVQVPGSLRNIDDPSTRKSFDVASTIFTVIWLAFLAIILYSFFQSCMRGSANRAPNNPGRPGGNPRSGFFPGGLNDDPSAPPPYSKTAPPTNEGWRPGFWTGAVLGGLGNHFLNNRRQTGYNPRAYDWERSQSYRPPSMFGQWRNTAQSEDRGEGSSNLGPMRQSTGIGGSNVR
ncbi:hypothetical protein B0H10DRAFT_1793068 [Mycena sp. CBHHK59/15]|nr:hypothetical protein B0H10DRAFT_1793068 [Mycena sp. CBHHK59/15]